MIELRFARDLYEGTAVDEAVKAFHGFAAFELAEEPTAWVVKLDAPEGAISEQQIAGELSNYALGLTVKQRGARS